MLDCQHRQHILLLGQGHAVVHLTVEVYGQVGDGQYGAFNAHEAHLGFRHALTRQHHAASQGQRTVHPCGHDGTAIEFGVQFHQTALALYLSIGLHAEAGAVRMCRNDAHATLCQGLLAHMESKNGGTVLCRKQFVATLHLRTRLTSLPLLVTSLCEALLYCLHREEVHGRGIHKIFQFHILYIY